MGLRLEAAAVTLGCWLALAPGAAGHAQETATLELSSLREDERWEYLAGAEVLRVERLGDTVNVSHALPSGEPPRTLLDCVLAESHCSIRIEELSGRTRVRLLKYQSEAQEELLLEDRGGRFALVAGMVATSRIGRVRRARGLEEPGRTQTLDSVAAAASSEVLLRCPEGDSWMQVPAEDAEGGYYSCQRHGHQLEVAGGATTSPRQRTW